MAQHPGNASAVQRTMADLIIGLVREFNDHPEQINSGSCSAFAGQLLTLALRSTDGGGLPAGCDVEEKTSFYNRAGHVWVRVDDRHYDAEAPYGVPEWWQLPIFLREALEYPRTIRGCVAIHGHLSCDGETIAEGHFTSPRDGRMTRPSTCRLCGEPMQEVWVRIATVEPLRARRKQA